jgi:DNA-binding transcriptional ArsR family regulator
MLPDPEEVSASVFAALADPNRRAILASLAEYGPSTATDLSGRLSITRQGITKHLGLLADAGLVSSDAGAHKRPRPGSP